ncbi:NADPH:quinone reductase-like Zn-dependent oxidoreductase [Nonomuraea polychroma]|uniref:NADPH:quinone reductase-like Zn-dependent oxidoreductase n=1 Tax=Nonomuraea polychroma TaxID=46176 RepID=A0A438MH00_9ACTN|nr:NAD(P)-dependent alcohol dehydrogenase [Nonomuraea polychroma]RVX45139.1 NADPH:quinone reductase-like Zn-dependent oxidoreductase [Nonomuraea polychroma]
MQAAVIDRYGPPDVVRVAQIPQPTPRADEVLVHVKAVAVTSADSRIRGARFPAGFAVFARLIFGVFRPRRKVLGSAFSGEVEAVGPHVRGIAPGDEVCGMTGLKLGAHAEYVATPAKKLARKPSKVSHEDAAGLLFGGSTALFFLRDKASVGPGTSVLVNGASGAIGTNAVQLAKHLGATVTGVTSKANVPLVAGLGAERIIDYTNDDLAGTTDRFDVVLDTVGNLSIASGRHLLTANGVLLLAVAGLGDNIRARGNVVTGTAPERVGDFELLLQLVADGKITVVLDKVYGLHDIAEAHRRVDSGHKVGNIVVRP